MIKNLFIPEKFGNRYIFPKRIIGLDIGRTHVHATQLYLKGTQTIIEKFVEIPLDLNNGNNYAERLTVALLSCKERVDSYNEVRTAIVSSLAIVKELKIPFIGREKIALVVDFEIEPLLPFSMNDAIIDFIITKEYPEEKSSDVLIVALQKTHLAQHLQMLDAAGINPDLVTIDLFALYGLYKQLPSYQDATKNTVLLDIGSQSTRIGYIQEGQLRFIRSLPKGIATIAKSLSETLNLQPHEAMETIIRFGLERYDTPQYTHALTTALSSFAADISFTLTSFSTKDHQAPISRIILVGSGADIKGLTNFFSTNLDIPCQLLAVQELLQLPHISSVQKTIPYQNVMSLSIALPSPITEGFNLRRKEFSKTSDSSMLNNQLITAGILLVLLMGSFFAYSFWQTRKLTTEAKNSTAEVIAALQEQFPKDLEGATDPEEAIDLARQAVAREEKLWFSFANPARTSFLTYLLELTSKIDKRSLGFVVDKLTLNENMMTMTARVRDHEALKLLEKALSESKLFTIEKQQNPNFTMKIKLIKSR